MSSVLALITLNVFHYRRYSSPLIFPSPILHPSSLMSSPLYSPTVRSVLCPISLSFLSDLPLWCLCLFLSCCFILFPLTLSFSDSGLSKSASRAPFCRLVMYIYLPVFLSLLCFPSVPSSGQLIYGSAVIPETLGIPWTHQLD